MAEQERYSCQQFDAAGKKYFISIAHRAAPGQEGAADLALTDGTAAWTAQGLTSEGIRGQGGAGKLRHLLAAVSELQEAELDYTMAVTVHDGSADLRASFQKSAAAPRTNVTVSLQAAMPAGPVIASMLELLVANLQALKATSLDLLQQNKAFEQQVTRTQDIVDKYVKAKEAHDRETNVKVAALLNAKKKKLRELQAQLDEAQAEIGRLRQGGAEPMDAEADDEGGGGPSHSRQQRRQQVVEDSEDEDEEDEEGDERDREQTDSPRRYDDY